MIFEETYRYLLYNVSSTEFDTCLYSLLTSDWDGVIQKSAEQVAEQVGSTKKYIHQVFKKFSSKKRRKIFVPVEDNGEVKYKFNLGPTANLGFNPKTDRYCKKYAFFYTDSFRKLPINAKRLLLMGAFRMSVLGSEQVVFNFNEIVPNVENQGHSLFNNIRLIEAINAISQSEISQIVKVGLVSNIFSRKKMVQFSFKSGILQDFLENHTERMLLRKKIFEAGYAEYISDDVCIELEKVAKYLFDSFVRLEKNFSKKNGVICDSKSELLKLARYIYNKSIGKLSGSLSVNKQFLAEPKQVSAYFSTIIYNEVLEQAKIFGHRAVSIESLLEDFHYLHQETVLKESGEILNYFEIKEHMNPVQNKYKLAQRIHVILCDWCKSWVHSRVKSLMEDLEVVTYRNSKKSAELKNKIKQKRGWSSVSDGIKQLKEFKSNILVQIDNFTSSVKSSGNKIVRDKQKSFEVFNKFKESLQFYFSTHLERAEHLNNLTSWITGN